MSGPKYNLRTQQTGDVRTGKIKEKKMVKTNNIYWVFSEASARKPCLAKSQGFGAIYSAQTSDDDPICICVSKCPDPLYHRHRHAVRWVMMDDELASEACRFLAVKRISRMRLPWVAQRRFLCGQLLRAWSQLLLGLLVTVSPPGALSLSGDWGARLERLSFLGTWSIKLLVGALVCTRWRGTVCHPDSLSSFLNFSSSVVPQSVWSDVGYNLDGLSSSLLDLGQSIMLAGSDPFLLIWPLTHNHDDACANKTLAEQASIVHSYQSTSGNKKPQKTQTFHQLPFRDRTNRLEEAKKKKINK